MARAAGERGPPALSFASLCPNTGLDTPAGPNLVFKDFPAKPEKFFVALVSSEVAQNQQSAALEGRRKKKPRPLSCGLRRSSPSSAIRVLVDLPPQRYLVATEPIQGKAGEIGQTQKAMREVGGDTGTSGEIVRIGLGQSTCCSRKAAWSQIAIDACSVLLAEYGIDNLSRRQSTRPTPNPPDPLAWISNSPVSTAVARRSRHSRLASRSTSSRSTADCASYSAITVASKARVILSILQRAGSRFQP